MTESSRKIGRNAAIAGIVLLSLGVCCVPTIGITSAIAIPQFIGYIRNAKVAEARTSLASLRNMVEMHCADTGTLPGPTGPTPPIPGSERQMFIATPEFTQLGFNPADPVYYSYSIEPTPGGIRVVARGDLDSDGLLSELAFTCTASPCACDGATSEVDVLE